MHQVLKMALDVARGMGYLHNRFEDEVRTHALRQHKTRTPYAVYMYAEYLPMIIQPSRHPRSMAQCHVGRPPDAHYTPRPQEPKPGAGVRPGGPGGREQLHGSVG